MGFEVAPIAWDQWLDQVPAAVAVVSALIRYCVIRLQQRFVASLSLMMPS